MLPINKPIYSEYWLHNWMSELETLNSDGEIVYSDNLLKLLHIKRVISNYISILTNKDLSVKFGSSGRSYNIDGKHIYLGSKIETKRHFDETVGLALHEASHTLLTDFTTIKILGLNIPKNIINFCNSNNIDLISIERFIRTIVNLVEDWYVDSWVMENYCGYIGYYEALYDLIYNSQKLIDILKSNECRGLDILSYEFRIINIFNPAADLNALPGLLEIFNLIDIKNIFRLTETKFRIRLAYEIVKVVLKNLNPTFNVSNAMYSDGYRESDLTIKHVADRISLGNQLLEDVELEAKDVINEQSKRIRGDFVKNCISEELSKLANFLDGKDASLVQVPVSCLDECGNNNINVNVSCIVATKFNKKLIEEGSRVCPLINAYLNSDKIICEDATYENVVNEGIFLGKKLGKKLLIQTEKKINKLIRKKRGKICKRLLHSIGCNMVDIFENCEEFYSSGACIHISVDSSSSMIGKKWKASIVMCIAIAKAMSMIRDVHVTISFRSTHSVNNMSYPYVLIAYDSKIDSVSKLNLFKYLKPMGGTPEGLSFSSIINHFVSVSPEEKIRYFLNISDGEPYFIFNDKNTVIYSGKTAVLHTKQQVDKIKKCGFKILSYFIKSNEKYCNANNLKNDFYEMYGKSAKIISPNNINEIAETVNRLFICRSS